MMVVSCCESPQAAVQGIQRSVIIIAEASSK